MKGLFVTATDTGAGKTQVTAAIARLWRREGRHFAVSKPVATGAERVGPGPRSGLLAEDTQLLAAAAGEVELQAITPFVFAAAAAPPVAAQAAGRILELEAVIAAVVRRWR